MMKSKNWLFRFLVIATSLCVIANAVLFIYDTFFYNLEQLPEGKRIATLSSENGVYTAEIYRIENSMGEAIRGQLYNNKTKKLKNFYWENNAHTATAYWLNNEMISVNGNVIDITRDVYDSRRPIIDDVADALRINR